MIVTRQNIADALSTVAGVKGYAKPPIAVKAGDAWPLVARLDHDGAGGWVVNWRILVTLPGTPREAPDAMDALLPAVTSALDSVAFVDSAEPVIIPTDAGEMPGLQINARSE